MEGTLLQTVYLTSGYPVSNLTHDVFIDVTIRYYDEVRIAIAHSRISEYQNSVKKQTRNIVG